MKSKLWFWLFYYLFLYRKLHRHHNIDHWYRISQVFLIFLTFSPSFVKHEKYIWMWYSEKNNSIILTNVPHNSDECQGCRNPGKINLKWKGSNCVLRKVFEEQKIKRKFQKKTTYIFKHFVFKSIFCLDD